MFADVTDTVPCYALPNDISLQKYEEILKGWLKVAHASPALSRPELASESDWQSLVTWALLSVSVRCLLS